MRFSRFALLLVHAAVFAGCSKPQTGNVSFAFDRPELMTLLCIDPDGGAGDPDAGSERQLVLPTRCCSPQPVLPDPEAPFTRDCPKSAPATPLLHALVTQSTRGEVAAVDLVNSQVIDSNVLIPGYTFVDVGGFPSALVVPEKRPHLDKLDPKKVHAMGAPWTYVTSVEDVQVRAVATCRFREGTSCGPEADYRADELDTATKFPLASAPRDMLIGPDDALWVTLPGSGGLVRIELSENFIEPFAMQNRTTPQEPEFFRVPPVDPAVSLLPKPEFDQPDYVTTCGLGYTFSSSPLGLPQAPKSEAMGAPSPAIMRYDVVSKLLFVSDATLPYLYVFSVEDGKLVSRGAANVGAPLRDFALTNEVPANAPSDLFATPSFQKVPSKRYLYALDDRDGSLMAFDLKTSAEGATLTPLFAPYPLAQLYSDRINLPGIGTALAIIDTRTLSPQPCGLGVPDKKNIVDTLKAEADDAAKTTDAGVQARAQARLDIAQSAGPASLRGVFVVVTSTSGDVSIFDVFDLDVFCRANASCKPPPNDTQLANSSAQALAVERHAPRLLTATSPTITVGGLNSLTASICDKKKSDADVVGVTGNYNFTPGLQGVVSGQSKSEPLVCIPTDPWNSLDQVWTVTNKTDIPNLSSPSGAFADRGDRLPGFDQLPANQAILLAPKGFDFCTRGALGQDQLANLIGSSSKDTRPDVVAFLSPPATWADAGAKCQTPVAGSEPTLVLKQAFSDHLVLEAPTSDPAPVEQLLTCYPDLVAFSVRSGDNYIVLGGGGLYLNRVTADPRTGECVLDDSKDVRLTSRITFDGTVPKQFTNPYVSFRLANPIPSSTVIQVSGTRSLLRDNDFDPNSSFPDALPASVRFFPDTNQLFVVDSASQGLRLFSLSPFSRSSQAFR